MNEKTFLFLVWFSAAVALAAVSSWIYVDSTTAIHTEAKSVKSTSSRIPSKADTRSNDSGIPEAATSTTGSVTRPTGTHDALEAFTSLAVAPSEPFIYDEWAEPAIFGMRRVKPNVLYDSTSLPPYDPLASTINRVSGVLFERSHPIYFRAKIEQDRVALGVLYFKSGDAVTFSEIYPPYLRNRFLWKLRTDATRLPGDVFSSASITVADEPVLDLFGDNQPIPYETYRFETLSNRKVAEEVLHFTRVFFGNIEPRAVMTPAYFIYSSGGQPWMILNKGGVGASMSSFHEIRYFGWKE